ncbi:guanine nucleotide binding protein, alpha subunit [Globomyces pollinis-pini]|nr:guanine nucleotide binding protein, alpha subunit [Globomyces pollinis-pini]
MTSESPNRTESVKNIEEFLKAEKIKYDAFLKEPKLLILGSSDSGKTTFLKQLRILYGQMFTMNELKEFKTQALKNILNTTEQLIVANGQEEKWNSLLTAIALFDFTSDTCFTEQLRNIIIGFWNDPSIQEIFQRDFNLYPCTINYFFENLNVIASKDYQLNNNDILLLRTVTKSVSDTIFEVQSTNNKPLRIHFYDVSGLKHHRKHWISYFEDVLSIIYIVAISSYDQMMIEDPTINRMMDAIDLFGYIVNHPLLKKPDVICFFNKSDLFKKKIERIPIKNTFPDFEGQQTTKDGLKYFRSKFINAVSNKSKTMTFHTTQCTDTTAMKTIIVNLQSSIVKGSLTAGGYV